MTHIIIYITITNVSSRNIEKLLFEEKINLSSTLVIRCEIGDKIKYNRRLNSMKNKTFLVRFSFILAVVMLVTSLSTVAFAAETNSDVSEFGDIIYVDEGVTVFYGNPYESEESEQAAKLAEQMATRALRHDYIWVDAYTDLTDTISIPASTSNPITYFTVRQESSISVPRSYVYVYRPDGSTCMILDLCGKSTIESADNVVSTTLLANEIRNEYTWNSGQLSLRWDVETRGSGARINLWVW